MKNRWLSRIIKNAGIDVNEFVGTYGTDDREIDVLLVTATDADYGNWTNGGHIKKYGDGTPWPNGVRRWTFEAKGSSGVGGPAAYGGDTYVYKKSTNYYFEDKPHEDNNTWTGAGVWGGAANGVLDPVNPERVEDTDDNGVLDIDEKDGNASPPHDDGDTNFDGDYPVTSAGAYPWEYNHDLSPKDIDSDGKVECPSKAQVPVNPDDEYTKAEVVRHTITHEMGHATGISGHCDNDTCVMYNATNNWNRDGHFCNDCRGEIRIHNN